MNAIFLSPHFPPNFAGFCAALKEAGANVLAIGDAPYDALTPHLKSALTEYYYLQDMSQYEGLLRAVAFLTHRHGKIDRIDSHNEHWLGLEAQLRQDFNIFGQKPSDLEFNRRKSGMKEIFRQAGVPTPAAEIVESAGQIRAFVEKHGFPVIFKPDVGVGAASIFRIDDEAHLAGVLARPPKDCLIEAFVAGALHSFDGVTDREGGIVFCASHHVSSGIMEIVTEKRPVHYYYQRDILPKVEEYGRRSVRAFRVRERFFHTEFLVRADGEPIALEINVRPPGAYSIDMMNWQCDVDLYRMWARLMVCGESHFEYERKHNVCHVARRDGVRYRHSHEDVLREVAPMLVMHLPFPKVFAGAMGDYAYYMRHPDLAELQKAIAYVEERE